MVSSVAIHSKSDARKRAAWFGCLVSAVAVSIWINLFHPQSIHYVFRAHLLASPQRFQALTLRMQENKTIHPNSKSSHQDLHFAGIKLDRSDEPTGRVLTDNKVECLAICESKHRVQEHQVTAFLQQISLPKISGIYDSDLARQLRWARWESQVASHSMQQFESTLAMQAELKSANNDEPDDAAKPNFVPASRSLTDDNHAPSNAYETEESQTRAQLAALVADRSARLRDLEHRFATYEEDLKGVLHLTTTVEVEAVADRIEIVNAVILIGVGVGSWLVALASYMAIVRVRYFRSRELFTDLQDRFGIPFLGSMMPSITTTKPLDRMYGYLLARGSKFEWLVRLCIVIIVGMALWRLTQDEIWRNLVLHQPLAAFSRLLDRM